MRILPFSRMVNDTDGNTEFLKVKDAYYFVENNQILTA